MDGEGKGREKGGGRRAREGISQHAELTSSVKSSISNIAERSGNSPEAKMKRTLAEMSKLYSKGWFSVRLAIPKVKTQGV